MAHISEAAPLQISRFYTGLYTYRNPLIVPIRQMGRRIIELYDAISDGLNMECSNRLTLTRRPGYTSVNSGTVPNGIFQYFFSFKPSSFPGQIYQLADATDAVWNYQPVPLAVNNEFVGLIPKETPALSTFATVGAYCYISQELFAQKWDGVGGPQGITNWGIDMYDSRYSQGPNHWSTGGNQGPAGLVPWTGIAPAEQAATVDLPRPAGNTETLLSQWLELWGYGFNFIGNPPQLGVLPAGIKVSMSVSSTQVSGISLNVRLLRNQAQYGVYRTVTLPVNAPVNIGSPSDLWDGAWTLNDINQYGFGLAIQAVNSSVADASFTVTLPLITVYVNVPPTVVPIPVATGEGLASQVGYSYKYCYGNSHSGHLSSPTPPSFVGTDPNGLITPNANTAVQINLPPSPDPQVDAIHVFRTTDGGGNPYFELPTSPYKNTPLVTQLVQDVAQDNLLQIANVCPDPEFNNPPPGGAIDPVWFAGRLWLHRGNQLFFSSGPDITMGNEAEAWYPVYAFAVPDQIVRKFPTPNGMLVVCLDTILIVRGISTASFTVNDFMKDTGMRVWTAGDSDGTNIYLYTSDRQLLLINANGLSTVASSIADRIAVVDPTKAYVCQYRYGSFENLLFLGDGSTTLYPFNVELQAWNTPQQPVGGVQAISTVERSPGLYQFWRARPVLQSTISFRDLTSWTDDGTAYPCNVIFGPIPVADFLTLAQMRDIVLTTASTTSQITLSVLANEIFPVAGSQFEILQISSTEPPELSATPSLSYTSNRYTWKSAPLPELVNLYFKRIDFSADPNPDELYLWTAGGTQTTGGSSLGAPGQLPQLQGR